MITRDLRIFASGLCFGGGLMGLSLLHTESITIGLAIGCLLLVIVVCIIQAIYELKRKLPPHDDDFY